jgi:hypothetical protein
LLIVVLCGGETAAEHHGDGPKMNGVARIRGIFERIRNGSDVPLSETKVR